MIKNPNILSAPWQKLNSVFTMFLAMNIPWVSSDFLVAPNASFNSGDIDLIFTEDIKLTKVLPILLDQGSGKIANLEFVKHQKVKAFILDPGPMVGPMVEVAPESTDNKKGILDVDGEEIPSGRIHVEILPSILNVIHPYWLPGATRPK